MQKGNVFFMMYCSLHVILFDICESFNASVRAQNINSNRLAPSRDISRHFAVQQHICHICDIGCTQEAVR